MNHLYAVLAGSAAGVLIGALVFYIQLCLSDGRQEISW